MIIKRLLVLAGLAGLTAGADAGTTSANLGVSATVSSTCSVTTSPVAFGDYNPTAGTADTATGTVAVTCTLGSSYSIALDAGANESTAGNANTRRMKANTSDYLSYGLYLDSGHTTVWGDGANGTSISPASGSHTGDGSAQSYDVYGSIPAGQYVAPGTYTDTVVATVTYN